MICPQCRRVFDAEARVCAYDGVPLVAEAAVRAPAGDGDLRPGDSVGDYRIQEKLGHGGMGVVYRAVQPVIGKRVAIKVLKRELASNPVEVARFVQEARAVNQIGHRNIIDIFTFGQLADGRHYFVMELLDGISLRQRLQQAPPLSALEVVEILRDVARALDAAHAHNIVHRDLKPDNVFLCNDDEGRPRTVKLLDFGIAKLLEESGDDALLRTKTGMVMGTPYYMSPEQCRGRNIDHRSDIYALGVLAFVMFTDRLPFHGDSFSDIMLKHLIEPPPLPSQLSARTPAAVNGPLLRALEKEPEQRYDRAGALVEGLEQALRAATGDAQTRLLDAMPGASETDVGQRVSADDASHSGATADAPTRVAKDSPSSADRMAAAASDAERETIPLEPVRSRRSKRRTIGPGEAALNIAERAARSAGPGETASVGARRATRVPRRVTPTSDDTEEVARGARTVDAASEPVTAADPARSGRSRQAALFGGILAAGALLAIGLGSGWFGLADMAGDPEAAPQYEIDAQWLEKVEPSSSSPGAGSVARTISTIGVAGGTTTAPVAGTSTIGVVGGTRAAPALGTTSTIGVVGGTTTAPALGTTTTIGVAGGTTTAPATGTTSTIGVVGGTTVGAALVGSGAGVTLEDLKRWRTPAPTPAPTGGTIRVQDLLDRAGTGITATPTPTPAPQNPRLEALRRSAGIAPTPTPAPGSSMLDVAHP